MFFLLGFTLSWPMPFDCGVYYYLFISIFFIFFVCACVIIKS